MFALLRRFGVSGGAFLTVCLVGMIVALVMVVRSAEARSEPLELLAIGVDGSAGQQVRAPAPDTSRRVDGRPIVPLLLRVRNVGTAPIRVARLDLLLPAQYRLRMPRGDTTVSFDPLLGQPLVRYRIDRLPRLPPGTTALPLDTLWIEVAAPSVRCLLTADSVPEFDAAPEPTAAALSQMQVYYAFRGGQLSRRNGGLLLLRLDGDRLTRPPQAPLQQGPMQLRQPAFPWPDVGPLRLEGTHTSTCGPTEDPEPMTTTLWRTARGGRVFALSIGGRPRKYLYDLDADSIAELEMWDENGDGRFEAQRRVAIPLPAYLFPPPAPPAPADTSAPGVPAASVRRTAPVDTVGRAAATRTDTLRAAPAADTSRAARPGPPRDTGRAAPPAPQPGDTSGGAPPVPPRRDTARPPARDTTSTPARARADTTAPPGRPAPQDTTTRPDTTARRDTTTRPDTTTRRDTTRTDTLAPRRFRMLGERVDSIGPDTTVRPDTTGDGGR